MENSCDALHSHRISSSISLSSGTESTTLMEPRESSTLSAESEEARLSVQVAELHGEVDESKDEANLELLEQKKGEVVALEAINKVIMNSLNFILLVEHPLQIYSGFNVKCDSSYVVWVLKKNW